MTGQTTFGDLLDAARGQLATAARPGHAPPGGEDLLAVTQSTRRLVHVLRRYALDVTTGFGTSPSRQTDPLQPWDVAVAVAQRELGRATALLTPPVTPRANPGARPTADAASRIDRAAVLLQAGRELLDTHFRPCPDGSRGHHTEWAPALATPTVRRALLTEVASLAQLTAVTSQRLARAPGWRGAPGPRHALVEAGQRLHALREITHVAQQHEPVPNAHRDLLRAYPASMLPPRRLPEPSADITSLCHGAITSAARLRRAAWQSASEPNPAPATITSLRQIAAASTVTSHHCELLLRAAGERATVHFPTAEISQEMIQAADNAARARASWLTVARTLDNFTTQSRLSPGPAAAEAPNLATWTGRLVYADPIWTLSSGPTSQQRAASTLVLNPTDLPLIVAAVHHAADALEAAAGAEHDQVQKAAQAGYLLVPTRSVPRATTTQPFTFAPEPRASELLGTYRAAGKASADTVSRLASLAASLAAPSRTLTSVSTAAGLDRHRRWGSVPDTIPARESSWPGPLETSIRDLGVTSPWLIQRAAALDRESAELILDAAAESEASHDGRAAIILSKSASTAAIVDDLRATDNPRTSALFQPTAHGPDVPEREA